MTRVLTYISLAYLVAIAALCSPIVALFVLPSPACYIVAALLVPFALGALYLSLPREVRFRASSLVVTSEAQPRFARFASRLAWLLGVNAPDRIYLGLAAEASAGIETTGSGFGVQRMVAIGLPLLQSLTLSELSTIVGRHLTFFSSGRATLWALVNHVSKFLGTPGLRRVFNSAVESMNIPRYLQSRDAVVEYFGEGDVLSAERKAAAVKLLFPVYWDHDVAPAIAAGVAPPLTEGFVRYLRNLSTDDYDLMQARQLLLEPANGARAIDLVNSLPEAELQVLEAFAGESLRVASWDEVGRLAYLEPWQMMLSKSQEVTGQINLEDLPGLAQNPAAVGHQILGQDESEEQIRSVGLEVLSITLANALAGAGWSFEYDAPGRPRTFALHGEHVDPYAAVGRLSRGELSTERWIRWLEKVGLRRNALAA